MAETADNGASVGAGKYLEPSAATATHFVYPQKSAICCLHHDTLVVDRIFQGHSADVLFIVADNVSERGLGKNIVSYDDNKVVIIWDLTNGTEISKFESVEPLRCAAWMKNGNLAFGNNNGEIVLFEPLTSENISTRTIFDPVTAIAPAADCRTYAIGYMNGSILIASLQPQFSIIHTLHTPRAPSPIVTLAWHGSSKTAKSDMLASQTLEGDVRVWAISRDPESYETPRTARHLKRSEHYYPGPNYLCWAKNGRILQFTNGEAVLWDVKTKQVSFEMVPVVQGVMAVAAHGGSAMFFSVTRNGCVQQYDLNPPSLVANVQQSQPALPPSPPVSLEDNSDMNVTDRQSIPLQLEDDISYSQNKSSDVQLMLEEMDELEQRRPATADPMSPTSSARRSRTGSVSSQSSMGLRPQKSSLSMRSGRSGRDDDTSTVFSGYTRRTNRTRFDDTTTIYSGSAVSRSQISNAGGPPRRTHPLQKEILRSPDAASASLFPFTHSRLTDGVYLHPSGRDPLSMSPDEIRFQILGVVFGWQHDVEFLIQDELDRSPPGSKNAILLTQWLGGVDASNMAAMLEGDADPTSWMIVALLSNINATSVSKQNALGMVQKQLAAGEVHAAAAILLALGDHLDALEVYVSHQMWMEALLMTMHFFKNDWRRTMELVRKWGKAAVERSQTSLAIRCLSCGGDQNSDSPQFVGPTPTLFSPPWTPPVHVQGLRDAKPGQYGLKLVTTFEAERQYGDRAKFFGIDEDRTPMNKVAVTPIDNSLLSPTVHEPVQRGRKGLTPASARTMTPGGFAGFNRLSAVEEQSDVEPTTATKTKKSLADVLPPMTYNRKRAESESTRPSITIHNPPQSPMEEVGRGRFPLPSPNHAAFDAHRERERSRASSATREKKPDGLTINWLNQGQERSTSSTNRQRRGRANTADYRSPSADQAPAFSPATTESTQYSMDSLVSPPPTGKTGDFVSSLDEARYYRKKATSRSRDESRVRRYGSSRATSAGSGAQSFDDSSDEREFQRVQERKLRKAREKKVPRDNGDGRSSRNRSTSRRPRERDVSQGRHDPHFAYPKRSPSSPVSMQPSDIPYRSRRELSGRQSRDDSYSRDTLAVSSPMTPVSREVSRNKYNRAVSPDRTTRGRTGSRARSRAASESRRRSPEESTTRRREQSRGRNQIRIDEPPMQSPITPGPMSPDKGRYAGSSDEADAERAAIDREKFRNRQRSSSRHTREASTSRRPQERETSRSRHNRSRAESVRDDAPPVPPVNPLRSRNRSISRDEDSRPTKSELRRSRSDRTLKKEIAQRELEERRKSLHRRHNEVFIDQGPLSSRSVSGIASTSVSLPPANEQNDPRTAGSFRSYTPQSGKLSVRQGPMSTKAVSPEALNSAASATSSISSASVPMGLPHNPRAMRHPRYIAPDAKEGDGIPAVPSMPDGLNSALGPLSSRSIASNMSAATAPVGGRPGLGRKASLDQLSPAVYTGPMSARSAVGNTTGWQPPQYQHQTQYAQASQDSNNSSLISPTSPPPPLPASMPMHPSFHHQVAPTDRSRKQPRVNTTQNAMPSPSGYDSIARTLEQNRSPSDTVQPIKNLPLNPANSNQVPPPPPMPVPPELQHLASATYQRGGPQQPQSARPTLDTGMRSHSYSSSIGKASTVGGFMGNEVGNATSPSDQHSMMNGQSPISSNGTITQATSPTFFNNGRRPSMSALDSSIGSLSNGNNGNGGYEEERRGGFMGRITNAVRGRSASRNVKEREKNTKSPVMGSDNGSGSVPAGQGQPSPGYSTPYGTMLESGVNGQSRMTPNGEVLAPPGPQPGYGNGNQKAERHPRDIRREMNKNEIRMGMI